MTQSGKKLPVAPNPKTLEKPQRKSCNKTSIQLLPTSCRFCSRWDVLLCSHFCVVVDSSWHIVSCILEAARTVAPLDLHACACVLPARNCCQLPRTRVTCLETRRVFWRTGFFGLLISSSCKIVIFLLLEGRCFLHATSVCWDADRRKSKVEQQLELLKEEIARESGLRRSSASEDADKAIVKDERNAVVRIYQRIKDGVVHTFYGFRLFFTDIRISLRLTWKLVKGQALTRKERRQVWCALFSSSYIYCFTGSKKCVLWGEGGSVSCKYRNHKNTGAWGRAVPVNLIRIRAKSCKYGIRISILFYNTYISSDNK